ncbi:MAG: molybdenum cofactor guanylyltransferase [Candidatus Bathyarchaeota archaeon]|nr:molybdenum cofactor guanylyltransferase [Candidatus Bathyarchaeota archaeon]
MDRSAVILAGGLSTRFGGEDKGLSTLDGKPMLNYVVDAVKGLVDEIIVVTSSQERADAYSKIVSAPVRFAVDIEQQKGPLIGALTGFEAAAGTYTLLLPYDSPFPNREVLALMLDLCIGKSAVVPRYTDQEIEPLHAVYNTKLALQAAKEEAAEGTYDMHTLVEKLHGVRYLSTLVIEQLDPDFKTFLNVNRPLDLKTAQALSKPRPTKAKKRR